MSDALDHIAGWEAAGLIDGTTADRLRAASAQPAVARPAELDHPPRDRSAAAAMFGPAVTIAEVFAYLGVAFLLAAWSSLMVRGGDQGGQEVTIGVMSLVAAGVMTGLGVWLGRGDERRSRGAGVAFLVAAAYVAGAALAFATSAGLAWPATAVISAGVALVAAIAVRLVHPSVLTQVAVLTWLTALAASSLAWVQNTFFVEGFSDVTGLPTRAGPDPIILVVASAAWWLTVAVCIALIGLREAGRAADDPTASRRAAVSRFWAGITAVTGLAIAVQQSAYQNGEWGRVLEPWVGVGALLVLSAVLVERAFRRDATSFIYAAALGLIVALTDFNLTYLSDSRELALLLEGLILLAVGFGAERLRRRIGGIPVEPPAVAPPNEPVVEAI